jgi:hypothetical protein
MPRSRFAWALSSHCLIEDGQYTIEAHMLHGVRRVLRDVAMKNLVIVGIVDYRVPDREAGMQFIRSQVGGKYDFKGAFGLALAPDRDWLEPGSWFCYELAAAGITNAGRDAFAYTGRITEQVLLSIKP